MCPTEIIAFSDRVKEFREINAEVVACSVDSPFTHLAWYVYNHYFQYGFELLFYIGSIPHEVRAVSAKWTYPSCLT